MLGTGMRRGEILALHWSDVHLMDRKLYVRWTLAAVSNGKSPPRAQDRGQPRLGSASPPGSWPPSTARPPCRWPLHPDGRRKASSSPAPTACPYARSGSSTSSANPPTEAASPNRPSRPAPHRRQHHHRRRHPHRRSALQDPAPLHSAIRSTSRYLLPKNPPTRPSWPSPTPLTRLTPSVALAWVRQCHRCIGVPGWRRVGRLLVHAGGSGHVLRTCVTRGGLALSQEAHPSASPG